MIVEINISYIKNTHWLAPKFERSEVELSNCERIVKKWGTAAFLSISRSESSVINVDRYASGGKTITWQDNELKNIYKDTNIILRLYDYVRNYNTELNKSHLWCLNPIGYIIYDYQGNIVAQELHESVTVSININIDLQTTQLINTSKMPNCMSEMSKYSKKQIDYYQYAHPCCDSSLQDINIFDFPLLNLNVAGLTYICGNGLPAILDNTECLKRLYTYTTIRCQYLSIKSKAEFFNIFCTLIATSMPYKPDFKYHGLNTNLIKEDIEYFDDPFLTESGDCEDLSLATLRICEYIQNMTFEHKGLQDLHEWSLNFVFAMGLVNLKSDEGLSAHMISLAIPINKSDHKIMIFESTAPTCSNIYNENNYKLKPVFKIYKNRDHLYGLLFVIFTNYFRWKGQSRIEFTHLNKQGKHGISIETLLTMTNPTFQDIFTAREYTRAQLDNLIYYARNAFPTSFLSTIKDKSITDSIYFKYESPDKIDKSTTKISFLIDIHTLLKIDIKKWIDSEKNIYSFIIHRQPLSPTLDSFFACIEYK